MREPKEILLRQMEVFLKEGNINQYVNHLLELFRNHLTCFCFLNERGADYWQAQFEQGEELYQNALDDEIWQGGDEEMYPFELTKGFLLLMIKDEKLAYEHLSLAIKQSYPNDISCLLRAHCKSEINPNRENDASMAVLQWPSALGYYRLAGIYRQKKEYREAKYFYERTLTFNKFASCAYRELSRCYGEEENPDNDKAIENVSTAIIQNPKDITAYYYKCYYLIVAELYEKAVECATEGLQLFSDEYALYYRLAYAQHALGDYSAALKSYTKYLERYPNDKDALKNIKSVKGALGVNEESHVQCLLQSHWKKSSVYDKNYFLFYYIPKSSDTLSSYVLKFKDNNDKILEALTWCAVDQLKSLIAQGLKIDYVVRALGSSETFAGEDKPLDIFARKVARDLGADYIRLLNKTRTTRKFAKYLSTYNERISEIENVYNISPLSSLVVEKRINVKNSFLIVDDVVTSGATLETIGKLLKEKFPTCTLYYFTIARTNRDTDCNNTIASKLIESYIKKVEWDDLPF